MTRLLLDIGLPRRAAADLIAAREGYVVVTLDFDFVRMAALSPRNRPSILHLRLPGLDRTFTVTLLRDILPQLEPELERGCIASVGQRGIRVRSLPLALDR